MQQLSATPALERAVGLGYRPELAPWIATAPPEVECLEVVAEHFYDGGTEHLQELARRYPLFVHGLGLSLGTPGPLDPGDLERFRGVVEAARPRWVSEHVAFTRTPEVDLGHLNPVRPDARTLAVLADHARELADACGVPVLLENVTSHLRIEGELSEPDFLNALCERAECGLLLDVTNLHVNARNHRFDALEWLRAIEPRHVVQLHVVGYSESHARLEDRHAEPIQKELWQLLEAVCDHAAVQAVVLERDANFPAPEELAGELRGLRRTLDRA